MLTRLVALLVYLAVLLLTGCATNPVTGGSDFVLMSEQQEISLGRRYNEEILKEMPAYRDPVLEELVTRVGDKLAAYSHRPEIDYRFTILDSSQVNAFALPGGYIYITRGMLAYLNSEAELAAVLGHEIGHVTARHSVRQQSTTAVTGVIGAVIAASTGIQGAGELTNIAGTAVVRGYGREHELEADRLGAEYLARAGYDPEAMLEVVTILKNQETFEIAAAKQEGRQPNVYHGLFSTHPDNDARFREVVNAAKQFETAAEPRVERDSFLLRLDGLTFGDSEREGIVRDNHFYHRDLDFALTFPAGWMINNQTSRIIATPASNDAIIQVTLGENRARLSPQQYMQQELELPLRRGAPFRANGMKGYTAVVTADTPFGTRPVRYAVVNRGSGSYIFAGAASSSADGSAFEDAILDTAGSLRPLTGKEKQLARAKKIDIIRAPRGTTWAGLAKDSPITHYPEQQLRLLNDQYPRGEPAANQTIKIVR